MTQSLGRSLCISCGVRLNRIGNVLCSRCTTRGLTNSLRETIASCPFCCASIRDAGSILYNNIPKFVYIKAIPRFCDKHLKRATEVIQNRVEKCPERYKDIVPQLRIRKYLDALKVEEVCRLI